MRDKIMKRIENIPLKILSDALNKLQKYNISYYNNDGAFDYEIFKDSCIATAEMLLKNDKPHLETNIRYQYCDFMSLVQTITGARYFNEFMSK